MSAPIVDGGLAFPYRETDANGQYWHHYGMTLRDYFAARCPLTFEESAKIYGMELSEIMRSTDHTAGFTAMDADLRASWADAMLAARKAAP